MFNVNHFIISQANIHVVVLLVSFDFNESVWSNQIMGVDEWCPSFFEEASNAFLISF